MRLYEEIVGRGGVSPTHFFYDMTFGEAAAFLRGMQRKERESWEQTRRIMHMIAQVNSTKDLDPEDVIRFVWDGDDLTEEQKERMRMDEEKELEELRKRAKKMNYE